MTNEEKVKAFEMRLNGATFQEIADAFGVTRQCVQQSVIGMVRAPKRYVCVYPGLKEYLYRNEFSIPRFNERCKACNCDNTLRRKLDGSYDFTMPEIKAILAFTGMTFEEAFGQPGGDLNGCKQQAEGSAV